MGSKHAIYQEMFFGGHLVVGESLSFRTHPFMDVDGKKACYWRREVGSERKDDRPFGLSAFLFWCEQWDSIGTPH